MPLVRYSVRAHERRKKKHHQTKQKQIYVKMPLSMEDAEKQFQNEALTEYRRYIKQREKIHAIYTHIQNELKL